MIPTLHVEKLIDVSSSKYDALIMVTVDPLNSQFSQEIVCAAAVDASISTSPVSFVSNPKCPGSRLVIVRTGSLIGDTDDSLLLFDLGKQAVSKAISIGSTRPLLYFPNGQPLNRKGGLNDNFSHYVESFMFGMMQQMYEPLQAREHYQKIVKSNVKLTDIGVLVDGLAPSSYEISLQKLLDYVQAVEQGKILARDMGGSDPERMSPLNCAAYIQESFKDFSNITISIEKDPSVLLKDYPCLHAVARCSLAVQRHHPCVVKLQYKSSEPSLVQENVFLVGKGVTYDTGGADIKAGGVMRGMSRDKCGATACAGFMKTLAILKPSRLNVTAYLGFVRNSVGADAYVSDEIIHSRAGVRLLVGNTDAEGRMVMCDLLAKSKEDAIALGDASIDGKAPARLLTVATLTGHAVRASGPYACVLDNGPARESGIAKRLAQAGHLYADGIEITSLRRVDYAFVTPGSSTEDVVQANDKASSATSRGHQFPMAFMSIASGMTKYGLDSEYPIAYTHMDIAGSAEESSAGGLSLPKTTGAPIAALAGAFI